MSAISWSLTLAMLGCASHVAAQDASDDRRPAQAAAEGSDDGSRASSSSHLSLADVIRSVREHHPAVLAERANLAAARGEEQAARGEFDTLLSVQGRAALAGYYDPRRADVLLEQPTPLWGTTVYSGYRVTRGNVAPYYGEHNTLDRGELRGGVRVPLLQDGRTDARRTGRQTAAAQTQAQGYVLDELLLDLERDAAQAYFAWIAAGQRVTILRALEELARVREDQVRDKVALGALPPIEQLDNTRSLLERRRQLIVAQRALEKAALDLSLYHRDQLGEPSVPPIAVLPDAEFEAVHVGGTLREAEAAGVAARPELSAYQALTRAARAERDFATNRVLPKLDTFAEVSRDFGTQVPTLAPTLEPTVVEVGVTFAIPLWLRKARGKLQAARAKLASTEAKARFAQDKVLTEIRDAWSQMEAASERVRVASKAAELAEQIAQGERERFELGATTLLFVNLREQSAADARIALIDANAEVQYSAARALTVMGTSLAE